MFDIQPMENKSKVAYNLPKPHLELPSSRVISIFASRQTNIFAKRRPTKESTELKARILSGTFNILEALNAVISFLSSFRESI